MTNKSTILLTGASGYLGGRLLPMLARRDVRVRCLARRLEFLRGRVAAQMEVVAGDVMDRAAVDAAMANVHTAYYMVHSMGAPGSYEEMDRVGAANFAEAAIATRTTWCPVIRWTAGESKSAILPNVSCLPRK